MTWSSGLTYGSAFSGIGGIDLGFDRAGHRAAWQCEIDTKCAKLLQAKWGVPLYGDVRTISDVEEVDILTGGFPCFVAGTLILTKRGQVPIEDVRVGDEVLTHRNRWRTVLRHHGSHVAPTVSLRGHGHPMLTTTANHGLWAAKRSRAGLAEPGWVEAGNMLGMHWATPSAFPEDKVPVDCPVSMYEAGRWVADGYVNGDLVIWTCAHQEADGLSAMLSVPHSIQRHGTATKIVSHYPYAAAWLTEHFGRYAHGKALPTWLLGCSVEDRREFLRGYVDGDGCTSQGGAKVTTVSKALAVGVRLLATGLGMSVACYYNPMPSTTVIEGRTVNQSSWWQLVMRDGFLHGNSSVESEGHRYGLVRAVCETGREEVVYNFEVEQDNSYVADGVVARNCQDVSVAGHRAGLAGKRSGLFHQFIRLIAEIAPTWVVIENVPGLLSSNGGRDMGAVLGNLADLGYGWAYRVLDAQYFGVAQRRRRVFIVGYLGNPARAAEVLFEPESCDRDSPPSREERSRTPRPIANSLSGVGGGNDYACGKGDLIIETLPEAQSGAITVGMDSDSLVTYDVAQPITCSHGNPGCVLPAVKSIPALTTRCGNTLDDQQTQQLVVAYPLAVRGRDGGASLEMGEEGLYNTLRAGDGSSSRQNLVAYDGQVQSVSENQRSELRLGDVCNLVTGGGKPGTGYPAVLLKDGRTDDGLTVRRLTPLECERLQGFPDGWTEGFKDSARYKMLGNAVCVPVAEWVGRGINSW